MLVGLHGQPHALELAGHALGDRALVPERARDPAQRGERLVEPGLLGLARRPHAAARGHCSKRPARIGSSPSGTASGARVDGVAPGGADELAEQRRRAVRARLELRVVLAGDEERVVGELDHLDEPLVRRGAGDDQPGGLEPLAEEVVDLVAMAVALVDDRLAVDLARLGVRVELHRVGPEPHRAAHVGDLLLLGQQVDDRVGGVRVELARVRALHPDDVAGEVRDRHLHAEADAQVRDPLLAGDPGGLDLALDPALAEAAGDQDAVGLLDPVADLLVVERLRVDPVDLDAAAVHEAGVAQRLDDRQVGVLELDVLADERDPDRARLLRGGGLVDHALPRAQVGRLGLEAEVLEHEVVDALGLEVERHLVDQVDVARGHDRLDGEAGEQRDLLADVVRQPALGAADHHVGLDADPAQLVDRVLRRLRLQLARVADVRHQREVDEHAAAPADVDRELPDRLEERQRLDVADRAADLRDDDVDVLALADELDPVLDLVGDVRDDLDGAAEVVAAPLLADHRVVDRARGHVRGARRVRVGEALVVAEVQVGLGAVLGDEHLAVLERRHRAGVDVDVRVELLEGDLQPPGDQQAADRGRCDALAERRDDAAGDEDVAGARAGIWHQALSRQSRTTSGGTQLVPAACANRPTRRRARLVGASPARARRSARGARSASARRCGGRGARRPRRARSARPRGPGAGRRPARA